MNAPTRGTTFSRLLLVTAALALAACASTPPAPPAPPPEPPKPVRDRVAALRTDAAASVSVVIEPLQNPAVALLREQAAKLEAAGKLAEAEKKLDIALTVEPSNPQLWQLKAEILLRHERYLDAEKLAMKSFDMGSRIGLWCARNWLLIAESRDALNDQSTSESARQRAKGCPVGPLIRY